MDETLIDDSDSFMKNYKQRQKKKDDTLSALAKKDPKNPVVADMQKENKEDKNEQDQKRQLNWDLVSDATYAAREDYFDDEKDFKGVVSDLIEALETIKSVV